jgi:hypothetical protein
MTIDIDELEALKRKTDALPDDGLHERTARECKRITEVQPATTCDVSRTVLARRFSACFRSERAFTSVPP